MGLRTAQKANVLCTFVAWTASGVVPKSYHREGQPRKTENELTNEDGFIKPKPNHNPNPKPDPNIEPNTKPNPKNKRNLEREKREPSRFELQNFQNPLFRVRQPNQLRQMTIRCKLHNFLDFYSTTRD